MTPIRLVVSASAGTREDLVAALYDLAAQFFDDASFRLAEPVDVEPEVEVATMQGPVKVTTWEGQATFVSVEG